jgi:hypothetical protein
LKISFFKIGIILGIIGIIWISIIFLQTDKISEEFQLESLNSHKLQLDFEGEDIGYYKIFMPEFAGEEVFVQILDTKKSVISEQSVQTKMSVAYFDFYKSGDYTVNITNISKKVIILQVELGNTNAQDMIPSGIMIGISGILIMIASFIKLKNYKIEHPDENIS